MQVRRQSAWPTRRECKRQRRYATAKRDGGSRQVVVRRRPHFVTGLNPWAIMAYECSVPSLRRVRITPTPCFAFGSIEITVLFDYTA